MRRCRSVATAAAIGNAQLTISTGGDAAASAVNNGEIFASAYASAYGATGFANADALGNVQVAMGVVADTYFDNSGDIPATVTAAAGNFR